MTNWRHIIDGGNDSSYVHMEMNLRLLKEQVVKWNVSMRRERETHLVQVEKKLEHLNFGSLIVFSSEGCRKEIVSLEKVKHKILETFKVEWRFKTKDLWLEVDNQNTKFFQKLVSHRWNYNTIWDLEDSSGVFVRGFKNLLDLVIAHFQI